MRPESRRNWNDARDEFEDGPIGLKVPAEPREVNVIRAYR